MNFSLAPSGPPSNISATALTSTSIVVSWEPPLPQYRNGPILAYNVTVTNAVTDSFVHSSIVPTTTTTTIGGLQPFTPYSFTLSARTSVGYGPPDTLTEVTLEDCKLNFKSN